jgi:hypothetical protein
VVAHDTPGRAVRRVLVRQLLRLRPVLAAYVARSGADRYRKRLFTWGQTCFLLFHGLNPGASLHASYEAFAACPDLLELSGLAMPTDDAAPPEVAISFRQLAASNTRRRPGFLAALLPPLVQQLGHDALGPGWPDLLLQDSTFLPLSLTLAGWLPRRTTKRNAGLRLQTQYRPAQDLPEHLLLLDTTYNDCTGLDASLLDDAARLAALRGDTLVMDLGYYSHRRFARLLAADIHFVTRVHPQARVAVLAQQEVQAPLVAGGSRITSQADAEVAVGSANNRQGTLLSGLRQVVALVEPGPAAARQGKGPQTYTLLTDRWDLTAAEVVQAYLWRWQIEIVCTQVTKVRLRAGLGGGDDVPNLHAVIRHDHPVDQQLHQLPALRERRALQAAA